MDFAVTVTGDAVKVRLPKNPQGTEYVRLDMSDGSVVFVRATHVLSGALAFPLKQTLISPLFWEHLAKKLHQKMVPMIMKHADEPFEIKVMGAHALSFRIGRPLTVTFEINVTQSGIILPATQRLNSGPINIIGASATTRKVARREIKARKT